MLRILLHHIEIEAYLEQRLPDDLNPSEEEINPELHTLQAEGLIKTDYHGPEYELSEKGREFLEEDMGREMLQKREQIIRRFFDI